MITVLKTHKSFGGLVRFWEHNSTSTSTKMKFSTYTPPGKVNGALIWLSGLTCTDENFITKAGAQEHLAKAGLMVICPDTSPRGLKLPQEHDSYDFGSGAGFYVNAITEGYRDHYRMYDYVSKEIYSILQSEFKMDTRISISGHSMGGHGALIIGLRESTQFKSISAFAPIANPINSAWGKKALSGYLGPVEKSWFEYDACELIKSGLAHDQPILIDQGTQDEFVVGQLKPENLQAACQSNAKQKLILRMQEGYDHSYYFIASFIREHIEFHASKMS